MIEKTEALALRVIPFSRTSHVVIWLTASHGKVSTMIKGSCRPRSLFLGQYDLFYTCELLFYTRERNGLHIARECSPINCRSALRTDWRAYVCASYIGDIVSRVSVHGAAQQELYALTTAALDSFCADGAHMSSLLRFELSLLNDLGLAPQLRTCSRCAGALAESGSDFFSAADGGMLCHGCVSPEAATALPTVAADVLAILRTWQAAGSTAASKNIRCTCNQLLAIRKIFGIFCGYHLDIPQEGRGIAMEMIESA